MTGLLTSKTQTRADHTTPRWPKCFEAPYVAILAHKKTAIFASDLQVIIGLESAQFVDSVSAKGARERFELAEIPGADGKTGR